MGAGVAEVESKLWEDVEEGEKLPTLEYPITTKVLIMAVTGTRDFMPYHHDDASVEPLGIRAMFVNTMFNQASYGKFVTDWSGPDSDFRGTNLQMVAQLVPGDSSTTNGVVVKKYRDGDDYLVDIECQTENQDQTASRSGATLAMPSREGGAVKVIGEMDKPTMELDPNIPDEAKEWLGKESPKSAGAYEISKSQIQYWCDMVEDGNPLYGDTEYARNSRHNGLIAPPMSLITWTMGRPGWSADYNEPSREPWPRREPSTIIAGFTPPGSTDTIASNSVQTYGVPLRPGDRLSSTSELVNCTPLKRTRLGLGYFMTNLSTYYNQKDEIVGTNLFTLLRYGVPESEAHRLIKK